MAKTKNTQQNSIDEIVRAGTEALLKSCARVADMRKSSEGKYTVIGVDKFDGEDWVQGTYKDAKTALRIAQEKTEEARRYASDISIATVYYAYDPQGRYLGGGSWKTKKNQ